MARRTKPTREPRNSDADTRKTRGWWHSLPGLLTAFAAIITALTGVLVALHSVGLATFKPAAVKSSQVEPTSQPAGTTAQNWQKTSTRNVRPAAVSAGTTVNLLAPENGGRLVSAPDRTWQITVDGKEHGKFISSAAGQEAVYAFRNNEVARFSEFAILVPETGDNIKQFELAVANDTPNGPFAPIDTFGVKNVRIEPDGYQVFTFEPSSGRYLRFKILSSYHPSYVLLTEFRLVGRVQNDGTGNQ